MIVKSESEVTQLSPTLSNSWTAAYQAPPSMGFSRQEYWSGLPLPSPTERHLLTNDEMMYYQLKRFVQLSVPETKKKKITVKTFHTDCQK